MLVESCFHLLTTDLRCRNFWNGRNQTRVCYFSEEFLKTFFEGIFFLLPGVLPFKIFTLILLQYVVDYWLLCFEEEIVG